MTTLVSRHFIAAVAAAAIVITGFSAVPARANEQDLGKALAALAGLAVLGLAIKNAREDDKKARPYRVERSHVDQDRYRQDTKRRVEPRPLPRRAHRKLLPQQCLRSVQGRDRRLRVFGERCLERNYDYAHSLPQRCGTRFQTKRGTRYGYRARCLSRHGYELARR